MNLYLVVLLSLGIKLINIHKVLKFKQSDQTKKDIDFNTGRRKNTKNEFEKLMNNSANSKTMKNLRKISNVRLVNNAKGYLRYISKPTFISQKHFSKTFAAVLEIT